MYEIGLAIAVRITAPIQNAIALPSFGQVTAPSSGNRYIPYYFRVHLLVDKYPSLAAEQKGKKLTRRYAMTPEIVLHPIQIDAESFAPFGQVIVPAEDGAPFGAADAQLVLTNGTPRLYIMRLCSRGLAFGDHAPCPRHAMPRGNGRAGMAAGRGAAARARRSLGDARSRAHRGFPRLGANRHQAASRHLACRAVLRCADDVPACIRGTPARMTRAQGPLFAGYGSYLARFHA